MSQSPKEQFHLFRIRTFQDPKSFEILLKEHAEKVSRFLKVKLPTAHDADDAYSEVCLRVWDYATRAKVDHFSGFVFAVTRSVIAEFYRSRASKPAEVAIETDDYEIPVESKHSGQKMKEWVDGELLKEAIAKLGDDDREAVTLKYLEGYSVRDVAQHLEKTENATNVLLHRALKKLRGIIEKSA